MKTAIVLSVKIIYRGLDKTKMVERRIAHKAPSTIIGFTLTTGKLSRKRLLQILDKILYFCHLTKIHQ